MTVNVTVRGVWLSVDGTYTPYTPAKVNADPDDCHDAEGGTFEVTAVDCNGQDITELVDYRMEEIAEAAAEVAAEQEGEVEDESD